tara:strand:+ start:20054 stop:20869 length:816 start_codon:yes stop_codon:yes gene_type:complete
MLIREALLEEGIYDPNILKAVFMAGGPGSGKSHTAKLIFGGDTENNLSSATAMGLKLVNSDPAFEANLEKAGISPSDLATMSDEEFEKVTMGPDSPRGRAKRTRDTQSGHYVDGRLGVVIDGTGDDFTKISKKKHEMEQLGYDTMMIFVNTSLEVALERNAARKRKLKPELVEDIWNDVQQNMGSFQGLFGGGNFIIVDNTKYGPISASIDKAVNAFLRKPIENPIGKRWIKQELDAKGSKAKLPRNKPGAGGGAKSARKISKLSHPRQES